MSKYLFFSITFLLLAFSVSAAPMPWGIAINENTNECAGYWGGDEFGFNPLPEGWEDYYPGGNVDILKTSYGDCFTTMADFTSYDTGKNWEKCCTSLGFDPLSSESFDVSVLAMLKEEMGCGRIDEGYGDFSFLLNGQECTVLRCSGINSSSFAKDGVEIYSVFQLTKYRYLNTSVGGCIIEPGTVDFKSCCNELGYQYVSENIGWKKDNENITKDNREIKNEDINRQDVNEKNNNTMIILFGGAVFLIAVFIIFWLMKKRK